MGECGEGLSGHLAETATLLNRAIECSLARRCGLPLTFYNVLSRIDRSQTGFLTMTQLATEIFLTSGGVTRLIDRMAAAGLVQRVGCPSDRRSMHLELSDEGRAMLERANAVHNETIESHLTGPLDANEREQLERSLGKIRESLRPS